MLPPNPQDFLKAIGVLNFDIGLTLSAACVMESDYYARLVFATIGPLLFLSMLYVTYTIASCRNRRALSRNSNSSSSGSVGSGDSVTKVVLEIQRKHLSILLFVMFLIYSSVSTTVFEAFGCDPLDDGVTYVRADYRLRCTGAEHRAYQIFAGFMILVYPVGIPLILGMWLFKHRYALSSTQEKTRGGAATNVAVVAVDGPIYSQRSIYFDNSGGDDTMRPQRAMAAPVTSTSRVTTDFGGQEREGRGSPSLRSRGMVAVVPHAQSPHLAQFAVLWEPYKPKVYYFEIVEFVRRILLTGVGIFIFPDSAPQVAIILLLAMFFAVVFEVLDPYERPLHTWLYRIGYIVVVLSMYLSLLLKVEMCNEKSQSQGVFAVVLVIVHCLMIVAIVAEAIHVAKEVWEEMLLGQDD